MNTYKIQYRPENSKEWKDSDFYKRMSQTEARDVLSEYKGYNPGTLTAHTHRKDATKVYFRAEPEQ